ncbi:MAG: hypothetical protein JW751_25405 [Polyangiaceae bacterium]|nr:hypothetical protein [Polyangiaceae bacterium]
MSQRQPRTWSSDSSRVTVDEGPSTIRVPAHEQVDALAPATPTSLDRLSRGASGTRWTTSFDAPGRGPASPTDEGEFVPIGLVAEEVDDEPDTIPTPPLAEE